MSQQTGYSGIGAKGRLLLVLDWTSDLETPKVLRLDARNLKKLWETWIQAFDCLRFDAKIRTLQYAVFACYRRVSFMHDGFRKLAWWQSVCAAIGLYRLQCLSLCYWRRAEGSKCMHGAIRKAFADYSTQNSFLSIVNMLLHRDCRQQTRNYNIYRVAQKPHRTECNFSTNCEIFIPKFLDFYGRDTGTIHNFKTNCFSYLQR